MLKTKGGMALRKDLRRKRFGKTQKQTDMDKRDRQEGEILQSSRPTFDLEGKGRGHRKGEKLTPARATADAYKGTTLF